VAARRLSTIQVGLLVEGAEMVAEAVGLSVAEVVSLVLSEPSHEQEEKEPAENAGPSLRGTAAIGG
jgi:hypothetical protein